MVFLCPPCLPRRQKRSLRRYGKPGHAPLCFSLLLLAGTLSFTVGHSEYNSLGLGAQEECDIILESVATNISLCHRKVGSFIAISSTKAHTSQVIPPWVTSSENVVELSDDGGWEHTETSEVLFLAPLCASAICSSLVAARVTPRRPSLPVLPLRPPHPWLALLWP